MTDAASVFALLKEYTDTDEIGAEEMLPLCQRALNFVLSKLKDTADKDDPLIGETAAAVARYLLFKKQSGVGLRFQKYKIGDITTERNAEKELQFESQLVCEALANAAGILRDGGFYFSAE